MRVIEERFLEGATTAETRAAQSAWRGALDAVVLVGLRGPGGVSRPGLPVIRVREPAELKAAWFVCCRTVALVAGPCSTPRQLEAVGRALRSLP